eukprot:GHVT01096671.1.p5 GENE.GHVT01096671.1~~GHVT01096671.1.p5  ORF type:complete len:136 (+),score=29.06 GHVT01096671.1:1219-1626(+)
MGRVEQSPVVVRVVTAIEPPHLAAAVAGGNKQIARTAWRKLQPPDAPSSLAFVQGLSEPVAQVPHANPFVVAPTEQAVGAGGVEGHGSHSGRVLLAVRRLGTSRRRRRLAAGGQRRAGKLTTIPHTDRTVIGARC